MSRLINKEVICSDRPNEKGIITFYNPDNGEMNIKYGSEVIITHISKCRIVK